MSPFNIYPAVDETYNFPQPVRKAVVDSPEFQAKLEEKTIAFKRVLASTDDFNLLTAPGYYHVTLYSIAQNILNAPPGMNLGTLKVERNGYTGVTQTYSWTEGFNQPRIMQRTFQPGSTNGIWTALNPYLTPLATGADLKQIKTPGIHEAVTPARAAALLNVPEAVKGQPGYLNVVIQYSSAQS